MNKYQILYQMAHKMSEKEFVVEANNVVINSEFDMERKSDKSKLVDLVKEKMLEFNGIPFYLLREKSNKVKISIPRHIFSYVLIEKIGLSDNQAGAVMNRDRTTLLHSVRVVNNMIDTKDKELNYYNDFINYDYFSEMNKIIE